MSTQKINKTSTLSLRISAETKNKLEREAEIDNRPASFLVENALNEFLEQKELRRQYVEIMAKEAKTGKYIPEKEFMSWFKNYCEGKVK